MANLPSPASWRQRIVQAVVLLLLIAVSARIIAAILEPLIPTLVIIVLLCAIGWFVISQRPR